MSSRERGAAVHPDTLDAYLRAIAAIPRLTPDEERRVGERIRQNGDEHATRRLVEANLRFVVSCAKRYRGLGVPFLDLIHEGNLGLIEAARRFDPSRNVKFITYAAWWIRQGLLCAVSGQGRIFSVPPKVSGAAARLARRASALAGALERWPTSAELAAGSDLTEADVARLLDLSAHHRSLSEPVGDGKAPHELGDLLAQEPMSGIEDELTRERLRDRIASALALLDAREREVLTLRFGLEDDEPQTLQQIGRRLGVSRERIRQIEGRAKEKLRASRAIRQLRGVLN